MTNFSFTVTDVLYLATLSLGASLNLCFFLNQFLECRVRRTVSLLITTLVTALIVLLYPHIPALVRSFSAPLLTLLLALLLYHGTFFRSLEIVAVYQICVLFLDLLFLASMRILDISYAAYTENRLFIWINNVVVTNVSLIPLALLLRPLLRQKGRSDTQSAADLTKILAALFLAVTVMIDFVFVLFSAERIMALAAVCAAAALLISAVLLVFWLFKRIEYIARQEREKELTEQEYQFAVEDRTQAAQYQKEISSLEENMTSRLRKLSRLIADQKISDAVSDLEESIADVQKIRRPEMLRNPLLDYLLASLEKRCDSTGIRLDTEIDPALDTGMEDVDFCTILSNIMDNAVNAACKAEDEKRFILLKIHRNGGILFIGCKNSTVPEEGAERTSRRFGHFGLFNIRETAAKYGGDVQIENHAETFTIQTLVYCR